MQHQENSDGEPMDFELWSMYFNAVERAEAIGSAEAMAILEEVVEVINNSADIKKPEALAMLSDAVKKMNATNAIENAKAIAVMDHCIELMEQAEASERTKVIDMLAKALKVIESAQSMKTPEEITKEVLTGILSPTEPKKRMSRNDKVKADAEALSRAKALKIVQNGANSAKDKRM